MDTTFKILVVLSHVVLVSYIVVLRLQARRVRSIGHLVRQRDAGKYSSVAYDYRNAPPEPSEDGYDGMDLDQLDMLRGVIHDNYHQMSTMLNGILVGLGKENAIRFRDGLVLYWDPSIEMFVAKSPDGTCVEPSVHDLVTAFVQKRAAADASATSKLKATKLKARGAKERSA